MCPNTARPPGLTEEGGPLSRTTKENEDKDRDED
jgi:hypothetical protein